MFGDGFNEFRFIHVIFLSVVVGKFLAVPARAFIPSRFGLVKHGVGSMAECWVKELQGLATPQK